MLLLEHYWNADTVLTSLAQGRQADAGMVNEGSKIMEG